MKEVDNATPENTAQLHAISPVLLKSSLRVGKIITSLSRIGEDMTTGGTSFKTPLGRVDTTNSHDIGDIIVFRYDLPHEGTRVDEHKTLDWSSDLGKWSVVLELRETHAPSHGQPRMSS